MKSRWLLNLALLVLVAGLALFVYLRPKTEVSTVQQSYSVSTMDIGQVTKVSIEVPAKQPVVFEKKQGQWMMLQPFQGRANPVEVGQIIAVAIASSTEKLPANDPARFGLDHPQLIVRLNDQQFNFGMYNPVGGEQFVEHGNAVYTLPINYSQNATIQPLELLDKHPLSRDETIVGFDFSALEQWQSSHLNLDIQPDGKWKVSAASAKPVQSEIKDWFEGWEWPHFEATSVEPATPDHSPHPFLIVKLANGKKVKLIKMQESPELLLVREDEQLQYHFPQDFGFTALNPPAGFKP
jgi:hypothetical protein